MMLHPRSRRLYASLVAVIAAAACDSGGSGGDHSLSAGLRAAVDGLKSDVVAAPTDASTIATRARVLADWADAYSMAGGEVGLEGPRIRLQSTLPPSGQGAINQGQNLDRLVREFTLRDEEGALGELTAESLGPFEARTYGTVRQTWTVGTRPVGTGGGFWVARHFSANFGAFQTDDPTLDGYITIETGDADAAFDKTVEMDVSSLVPQVTWGTNPGMVTGVDGRVPDPAHARDANEREAWQRALHYMDLRPGTPITEIAIDKVFIGSCTNSRIEDLREAARFADGRKVAPGVQVLVVPGSGLVRKAAEAEGLDRIFTRAGFEWREPGCSMCLGMNPDILQPGQRCASTSNRNFEGRQGAGGRTHLVSPAMAAAAAVEGRFVDVRTLNVE
ncbi:MAG: hypothetical protein IIA41_07970 [SAR324 cluster bacterium]|nr:hypothetical protein [SAR324 cluster bacterium]